MKSKDKLKFIEFLNGIQDGKKTYAPYTADSEIKLIEDKLDTPMDVLNIIANSMFMDDKTKIKLGKYYINLEINT